METQIGTSGFISIGLAIVVIGALWKLSSLLTEIKLKLDHLALTAPRLTHIEHYLLENEADINFLFGCVRKLTGDGSVEPRKSRFRPFRDE